ncbi:Lateral organ boundary [Vigna unguiculata]|uniref:Lateral organ boundary n=1 Tax=Vigna unguiculata TaxID=3917 RepID=A0A4D6LTD1_VIGUN|nr:Lateral organ boundary [Vigna unguiculata]
MRLSCNGCRVLRRGCTVECPIRTSLQWISCPDSQSNATLFLAKFYGRQGLLNLLTNAPSHLQPAVFKSLLYEACGRMVNPIFGSTGLLSTGNWHLCEAAAKAVLSGAPIQQALLDGAESLHFKDCDIRHVAKGHKSCGGPDALHRVKSRTSKLKRRAAKPKVESFVAELAQNELDGRGSLSQDSASGLTRTSENKIIGGEADSSCSENVVEPARANDEEIELHLTLGWGPVKKSTTPVVPRVGLDLSG